MTAIGRQAAAATAALLLTACASSPVRQAPPQEDTFYGVAGDRLVKIDPATGAATAVLTAGELRDVRALTWDPTAGTLYALAGADTDPRLVRIDPDTGVVETVGAIDPEDSDLGLAEGLAFDPADGRLYATGPGPQRSRARGGFATFASNQLLAVDVATGRARVVAAVRGTLQDELDALVAFQGRLYGIDAAAGVSHLYVIDAESGRASATGRSFPGVVQDLVFDPQRRRLLATVEGEPVLLAMAWGDGKVTEIPSTGEALGALTCTCALQGLLVDDFESGDLSGWGTDGAPPDEGT